MAIAVFGMAAVGGLGTLVGGIIGALFYRLIPEIAAGLQHYQAILFAPLMLLALIAFRDGLYGLLERLLPRRRAAPAAVPQAASPPSPAIAVSAGTGAPELLTVGGLSV